MEISQVRKRVQSAIASARDRAQQRRQRSDAAEREFALFVQTIATPLAQQAATALKAEGLPFTVFTPGDGVRLVYDRGRDNFVEFALDTTGDRPQVMGRISQTRGSRGFEEERPLRLNAAPSELTEDEVLEFLMQAVESWLAR